MITPVAINNIGYRYYILYAVIGFCIPASIYFLYPETMGLTLEEIDLVFRESPSTFATVKFARQKRHNFLEEEAEGKVEVLHDEKN